jgi:plasmid stabilization system protein ParE
MRIRWTQPAACDLTHICDYTKERDSQAAARRVALAIYEGISSLTQFPQRGRPGRKGNTRELVFSGLPFIVVYRVREDVIEINRILHGAQRWP